MCMYFFQDKYISSVYFFSSNLSAQVAIQKHTPNFLSVVSVMFA